MRVLLETTIVLDEDDGPQGYNIEFDTETNKYKFWPDHPWPNLSGTYMDAIPKATHMDVNRSFISRMFGDDILWVLDEMVEANVEYFDGR